MILLYLLATDSVPVHLGTADVEFSYWLLFSVGLHYFLPPSLASKLL